MSRRTNSWVWVAAAVAASVVVAVARIAVASDVDLGLPPAVSGVARVAFIPFWLSYTGAAWVALGFRQFTYVRDHARELGLAFAAAIVVHLGLLAWQISRGFTPPPTVVVLFGAAALLTLLLCVISLSAVYRRLPPGALAKFRSYATTYIALVYLYDFAIRPQPASFHYWVVYASFAALDALGLAVRALAGVRDLGWIWRGGAAAR